MDAEVTQADRTRAAQIVGSMSDAALQESLKADIAQALANAEVRGENRQHGRIRVLRLLEYVYPDAEAMVADMGHWQIQSQRRMGGTRITSTVLPPEVMD